MAVSLVGFSFIKKNILKIETLKVSWYGRLWESRLLVFYLQIQIVFFNMAMLMLSWNVNTYTVYFSVKLKNICYCRQTSGGETRHFYRKINYSDHKKSSSENFQHPYSLRGWRKYFNRWNLFFYVFILLFVDTCSMVVILLDAEKWRDTELKMTWSFFSVIIVLIHSVYCLDCTLLKCSKIR